MRLYGFLLVTEMRNANTSEITVFLKTCPTVLRVCLSVCIKSGARRNGGTGIETGTGAVERRVSAGECGAGGRERGEVCGRCNVHGKQTLFSAFFIEAREKRARKRILQLSTFEHSRMYHKY
jgi:hypothetical protein